MTLTRSAALLTLTLTLALSACGGGGGSSGGGGGNPDPLPATYAFESRFDQGRSSVSYNGQVSRQILIQEMVDIMEGLTAEIDGGSNPADGDTFDRLNFIVNYDNTVTPGKMHTITTTPPVLDSTYDAIDTGKNLIDKLAGNDASTDHKDWDANGNFVGWSDTSIAASGGSVNTPAGLLTAFLQTLDDLAVDRANGTIPNIPGTSTPIPSVTVTASGLDLRQLIQKFLLMAVNYSQGTDDYLDDATPNKGLLTDNSSRQSGTAAWSTLEHQWDEGWGYFGAARNYGDYTDAEIAGAGGRSDYQVYNDANNDGFIDLTSEFNFGASTNAAKRDRGSDPAAPTDFTAQAFEGFRRGRKIIHDAVGRSLTADELTALQAARDRAVLAWEKAIAATVVHYINDVLQDMNDFGTGSYSFINHAKHWAELKGFALGLQFNPRSQLTDSEFAMFHTLVGDSPVLETATAMTIDNYKQALRDARTILGNAYNFAPENLGDADGNNGW